MAANYIVYGTLGSPFVRKVLVTMAEKELAWTLEEVNIFDPPDWFQTLSPAKRIPVLRDPAVGTDGVVGTIPDSSAICAYLERKHPEPRLYPADPYDYGRALWLEEWADTVLAVRIGFGFLRSLMVADEPDLERARKTWHKDLPPLFDYLEELLEGRDYAVGDGYSIADVALSCQLAGMYITRVPMDAARWPSVVDYAIRMFERPTLAARLAELEPIRPAEEFLP